MDVMDAIRNRRSIRKYENRSIEKEKLDSVLEAARLAPSSGNRQTWKFIAVKDKGTREKLATAANNQKFVAEAPVVIAACATEIPHLLPCGLLSYPINMAIAMVHMMLAAEGQGLGTCWIGAFDEIEVRKILGIPETARVVAMLAVGYPAEKPAPTPRKNREEVILYEKWG